MSTQSMNNEIHHHRRNKAKHGQSYGRLSSVTIQSGEQISKSSCGNSQAYTQATNTMKDAGSKLETRYCQK